LRAALAVERGTGEVVVVVMHEESPDVSLLYRRDITIYR